MDRLTMRDTLRIRLARAENELSIFDPDYQAELRRFYGQLQANHERTGAGLLSIDENGAEGGLTGEFLIPLEHLRTLVVTSAVIGWCQNRAGRTAHLKVGTHKAQVDSLVECDRFLEQVKRPS